MKFVGLAIWIAFTFTGCESGPKVDVRPGSQQKAVKSVRHGDLRTRLEISPTQIVSGPDQYLNATFTVENLSDESVEFTFNTTQQYDFYIEDSAGNEFWRWSDDRVFGQMIVEKSLGNEPWVYEERIPTVDSDGNSLPPGAYRLVAELKAGLELETEVPFTIR